MARLKELYDFAKYVREVEYTDKVLKFQTNHHEAWKQYANQTGVTEKEAIVLGERAAHERYVEFKPLNDIDGPPNKVIVSPIKGDDLLDRTVFGLVPKGLWLAYAEKNIALVRIVSFVGGIVVGAIGLILGQGSFLELMDNGSK